MPTPPPHNSPFRMASTHDKCGDSRIRPTPLDRPTSNTTTKSTTPTRMTQTNISFQGETTNPPPRKLRETTKPAHPTQPRDRPNHPYVAVSLAVPTHPRTKISGERHCPDRPSHLESQPKHAIVPATPPTRNRRVTRRESGRATAARPPAAGPAATGVPGTPPPSR